MPRFLNARPQQNRLQQTAMPQNMGPAQQAPSMSQGPQQAGIMQQNRLQQAATPQNMGPMGPQQAAQQTAMPLGDGFKGAGAGMQPMPVGGMSDLQRAAGMASMGVKPLTPPPSGPVAPRGSGAGMQPAAPVGGPATKLGTALGKPMKTGGTVSASKRADGVAQRGKTKGRIC